MSDLEQKILQGINRAIKFKGTSRRDLSELIDVPYRSLQNYLLGTSKMPASVYVRLCQELGIDNQYILNETFEFAHMPHWDALWDVLGDGLLKIEFLPDTTEPMENRSDHNVKQEIAHKLTSRLNAAYDARMMQLLKESHLTGAMSTSSQRDEKRRK